MLTEVQILYLPPIRECDVIGKRVRLKPEFLWVRIPPLAPNEDGYPLSAGKTDATMGEQTLLPSFIY